MKKYKIGQFAKAMGVTIDFLRYYEERGLITSLQDDKNHYHYYDFSQSLVVSRIMYLRSMGFPAKEIQRILLNSDNMEALSLYHAQRERLRKEIAAYRYAEETLGFFEESLMGGNRNDWYIVHQKPFYFLPHTTNEEFNTDEETMERTSEWRNAAPYTYDTDYWPARRAKKEDKLYFPIVHHGLAVDVGIANEIGLNTEKPVILFSGGRYLEYHINTPMTERFTPNNHLTQMSYRKVFELIEEKQMKITGDMFVRFITIFCENGIYYDHSVVYVPIE
ncbi:MAG: MerR family transcriptional regulator [Oscillospiraceae bacterium]|nr:MerR family transcriptional regulator [Oscillospiraceae bacterium]